MGMFFLISRADLKKMKKVVSAFFALVLSWQVSAAPLPLTVQEALDSLQIDKRHLVISVQPVQEADSSLEFFWQADKPVLPASSAKIVTTLAALDILGPSYHWKTRFYHDGTIKNKVLKGNLWIQGGGDPHYVAENLWRDAMRLKSLGIKSIQGNVYIDRTLFNQPSQAQFDQNRSRPYNLQADAALYNFSTVVVGVTPDENAHRARLSLMPPLRGMQLPETVALAPGYCGGWKNQLRADTRSFLAPKFNGSYPRGCPEKNYMYTVSDANAYWQAALGGIFDQVGITWKGKVKDGTLPENAKWLLTAPSEDLAQIIRYTNKWSNNVLARHIFLSLAYQEGGPLNYEKSRAVLAQWLQTQVGLKDGEIQLDNGSGLSRYSQVTALAMTKVLRYGYANVRAGEWISSFPISATDGTMRRRMAAPGHAYLKTGYLRDVKTIAGVIQSQRGVRYVIYAGIEDKKASQANAVLDALIQWVYEVG